MRHALILLSTLILALPVSDIEAGTDVRSSDLTPRRIDNSRIIFQHRNNRGDIQTLRLGSESTSSDVQRELLKLRARRDIAYAVVDQRRHLHAIPSDALYPSQWFLHSAQASAIDATTAWDITTGGSGTVVAVLDTGVRFDHPDLQRAAHAGKLLPGFDFVSGENSSSFLAANDGNGWDSDPSDPGDWIDSADQQRPLFDECTIEHSSWHGTRVAGLIGAASNNGIGVSGVSWSAFILPVRVLGKCGGYDSDILPAMRWAAGLPVSGVPDNPYPAKILNLSLGSADPCNAAYQSVIQELAAIGVLVVVSAGNDGGPVNSPANCPYAVGVAGLRHAGTKVGFSSLGPQI
jgi:serine protease